MEAKGSDTVSKESNKVLKDLLKCQRFEGNHIYVNYKDNMLCGLRDSCEPPSEVKFRYSPSTMISIFKHLSEKGLIRNTSGESWDEIVVTHDGNHQWQHTLSCIAKFLSNSIAVPIVVSIATTIVYHLLGLWIPWFKAT